MAEEKRNSVHFYFVFFFALALLRYSNIYKTQFIYLSFQIFRELIEIIRQLNDMSDAVKQALIGIVVRKKLQHKHYKHKEISYTKS